jgi:hypothetical protein
MSDQIEHDPNKKPSKYPRKVFFGLITDYGPPTKEEMGIEFWISLTIMMAGMWFVRNGWPW